MKTKNGAIKLAVAVLAVVVLVVIILFAVKKKGTTNSDREIAFSDDIFISHTFNERGVGYEAEMMPGTIVYHKNGDATLVFEGEEVYSEHIDNFDKIMKKIDINKLCRVDLESDKSVEDAASAYYYLYDKNDQVIVTIGGYNPSSDEFWEPRNLLEKNIDKDAFTTALEDARQKYAEEHGLWYEGKNN